MLHNYTIWEKIASSKESNILRLNLSNLKISILPEEIKLPPHITTLDLSSNNLFEIPKQVYSLKNLQVLLINDNNIHTITNEIEELEYLTYLDLSANKINVIPQSIFKINKLAYLYLKSNNIEILHKDIVNLKELKALYLNNNCFTKFPDVLSKLNNLEIIDLSNNNIKNIPDQITNIKNLSKLFLSNNQIRLLPLSLAKLNNLTEIRINGNKLEYPPVEIISQGTNAIINYLKSLQSSKSVFKIFEAKLLIVGSGGVGKTYLMNKIIHNKINKKGISTEGIDINKWEIKTKICDRFIINFWDFGGQEIYHATHQFFLTKRSLYIFAWEARRDEDLISFDYWLNTIKLLSMSSPIIVVMNKMDERVKEIDEETLRNKFPNIGSFHKVSAIKGTNIGLLIENIKSEIVKLEHIGDTLPLAWVHIREELEKLNRNFINIKDYYNICKRYLFNRTEADHLSRYFHDLGVFLHFQDHRILKTIIFLKPEWATNAVYKLIGTIEIQNNFGRFDISVLTKVWSKYPEDKHIHLLELMKQFELCFEIHDKNYIIPELLSITKPHYNWKYENNLMFEYKYEFMPAGIMTRFIVRISDLIKDNLYWKNGVILAHDNTKALIISDIYNRSLKVWIDGDDKKSILEIIRREIDYIHKTLNSPPNTERIPCICSECKRSGMPYYHSYDNLKLAMLKSVTKIQCHCSYEYISIKDLLGFLETDTYSIAEREIIEKLDKLIGKNETEESLLKKANELVMLQPNIMGIGLNLNSIVKNVLLKMERLKKS